MAQPMPTSNYVTYYDPAKSHHRAWLQAVLDRLHQLDPTALAEGSELRDVWKAAVTIKAPVPGDGLPAPAAEAVPEQAATSFPAAISAGRNDPVAVALPLIQQFESCRLGVAWYAFCWSIRTDRVFALCR